MQPYLDLIAVATALVAIWYTVRESRRNNSVLLAIRDCATSLTDAVHENGGRPFVEFKIIIQNTGIPLHHVRAAVAFRDAQGSARLTLPLRRRERSGNCDEFAKGMIVEFGLKSYELSEHDRMLLRMLQDPRHQRAQVRVFSQDYLATSFRVAGTMDRVKSYWNGCADRFNGFFTHSAGTSQDGRGVIRTYNVLPLWPTLERQLIDFVRWTEEQESPQRRAAS